MSSRIKEKAEKLQQIIDELSEESAKGIPIIVEGQKDTQTLRDLCVFGPILTVKTGGKSFIQALFEIEKTQASEVILLLDFDKRGKQGTQRLKQNLEHEKIKPNLTFWRALSVLLGREIQCIESLTAYIETLKKKTAPKL